MIKFFEFLNTCSPERTVAYLLFIIIMTYVIFIGVVGIVNTIRGYGHETRRDEEETIK